ncbi:MAG: hypothetical protein M1158_01765 [Candidatus Marsarchaeota archaeon]|nr:hypothetical protein [Candidatus Marsarchaeota archaeon]
MPSIDYTPYNVSVPLRGAGEPIKQAGDRGQETHRAMASIHSWLRREGHRPEADGPDGGQPIVKKNSHTFVYQVTAMFSPLAAAAGLAWAGLKTNDPHLVVYAFGTVIAGTFMSIGSIIVWGAGEESSG